MNVAATIKNRLKTRQKAEESAADLPGLMARAEKAVSSLLHGEHNQRKPGSGVQFWQFRDYAPQDRPQEIDWRQSARTDNVFIRQKERETPQTALFWCSSSPGMDFHSNAAPDTKKQAGQILTLALSILITRAGDRIGVYGSNKTGRSDAALERIGNALFEPETTADIPGTTAVKTPKNALVFLTGDFLSPLEDIERHFKNLAAQTGNAFIIQILDPAEIELPYQGRAIFEDPRGAHRQNIENIASIRTAYTDKIQAHIERLQRLCRDYGYGYALHRTDHPVSETLLNIWSMFQTGRRAQ